MAAAAWDLLITNIHLATMADPAASSGAPSASPGYGEVHDAAIAVRDGRNSGGTFRFTRVWVKQAGRWVTAAIQETATR